ncbi:MAG TPA: hypothetical protein PLN69_06565 [bacterium]|nr:hypothetical protein [bacterium]
MNSFLFLLNYSNILEIHSAHVERFGGEADVMRIQLLHDTIEKAKSNFERNKKN